MANSHPTCTVKKSANAEQVRTSALLGTLSYSLVLAASAFLLMNLSACSGGEVEQAKSVSASAAPAPISSATLEFREELPSVDATKEMARASFHIAPVVLPEPIDEKISNSAHQKARQEAVNVESLNLSQRGAPLTEIQRGLQIQKDNYAAMIKAGIAPPPAATAMVATYTPAQVRAAYGLPALPSTTTYTAAQAASLGAGQTIYVVDAMHNPNTAAELAAFNQKFALPNCTTKTVATNATLPLAAPSTNACDLVIVYSTAAGAMTSTAPAYDSGWATEISLDVQWVHAIAPLARIVLIEAPDASVNSLTNAVKLANAMGPGVVSMSFGAKEGSWTSAYDSAFTATGMSYLAATGDFGMEVEWPSVSSNVLAIGGTSLTYSGTGNRSEVAWSQTGGGISAYLATPKYQTSSVPGMGTAVRRTVADVAFNANPSTGQYVASMTPGSSTVNWISAGGTSLSTPQWAGLIAIANANRALTGKAKIGAPHTLLYGNIASVAGNYSSAFLDITSGSHGTCATCSTKTGYDQVTGLGTPNVTSLLNLLSNAGAAAAPPSITAATISGVSGTALSYTVAATGSNPLSFTLTGAPSGMAISSSGILTWASPVVGTYTVTVTAKDSVANLSSQAVLTIKITAPVPPSITAASINATVGKALSFTVTASGANPLTYSLSGAPTGMTISTAGAVSWAAPVLGKYSVTVIVKDSKTGLTAQAIYTVTVVNPPAPTIAATSISGAVGKALSFNVTSVASNTVTYTMSGAPSGMSVSSAGAVTWTAPILGKYTVTFTAKDAVSGLTGSGIYTITIVNPPAPIVTAQSISGKVGTALSFTPQVTASNPVTYTMTGAPSGMTIASTGLVSWASPVLGNYTVTIVAKDKVTGSSGQASFTVSIVNPPAPTVAAQTVSGTVGKALSFTPLVSATNPLTYTLTGAPSGMSVSTTGVISWTTPVAGTYNVVLTVKDTKTGLSGQATMTVVITVAGPVITAAAQTGVVGKALTGTITITDPGVAYISVSISGVPLGMSMVMSGTTITTNWPAPVAGSYTLKVTVTDSAGRTATANVPVTIAAK
ncbi:putative Ig domain-containing protein [Undibacterium cyanobacteriorum]|uniref:Ig domain-containing protein n=1 Tax=Undibacterium cyanobacteriorum TaxID=3073561 RepID=A0ABY9RFP4_9BURK|nr:putative Ig domain-containing protein [Undibacterium sp. 20NA77.5]WMW80039.1 putative Ig domain-containing protein [Undibacterium sp. 20NA77.5]